MPQVAGPFATDQLIVAEFPATNIDWGNTELKTTGGALPGNLAGGAVVVGGL